MSYSLTKATLWNIVGYTYLLLASFISIPILISSLGLATFSQYAIILATLAIASSIDLGLSAAVVRKLSRDDHGEHHLVWSTSRFLFLITGLIAATIATLIVSSLGISASILPIVFFHTLTSHILAHYLTLPQAHGRFDLYNIRVFLVGTANTLISALLASYGFGIDALLIAQLIAGVLTVFILFRYSRRHFELFQLRPTRAHSKELLTFGVKNQIGKLMGQIGAQYGKFLLATISPLAVASYSIAQNITNKLSGSITQLSTALYPRSSRDPYSHNLIKLYYRLQFALIILSILGIILFQLSGYAFLTWWLDSPELVTAVYSILRIQVWYLALLVLTPIPSIILDSLGKPGLTSLLGVITLIIELTLAVTLLPTIGLLAPAYSALTSLIVMLPILAFVTHHFLTHSRKKQSPA